MKALRFCGATLLSAALVVNGSLAGLAPAFAATKTTLAERIVPGIGDVRLPLGTGELTSAKRLPEAAQAQERAGLGALTDGDTTTAFTAFDTATVRYSVDGGRDLAGLRVYGPAPYRLKLRAVSGGKTNPVQGLQSVDLSDLDAGWTYIPAGEAAEFDGVEIVLDPLSKADGSGLPEIEVWAAGTSTNGLPLEASADGALVLPMSDAETVLSPSLDDGGAVSLEATLPHGASDIRRAALVYELDGLGHWSEARRSVNGAPAMGGHLRTASDGWATQVEPIAPDLLSAGRNGFVFLGIEGGESYSLRNARLVVDLADGRSAIDAVTSDGASVVDLLDGNADTGWAPYPSNLADRSAAPALTAELAGAIALDRVHVAFDRALDGLVAVDLKTGAGWQNDVVQVAAASLGTDDAIDLPAFAPATAVRLRFAGGEAAARVVELAVSGSPEGSQDVEPDLAITYPDAGQYHGQTAYLRGYLRPVANKDGEARIVVAGKPVTHVRGSFEVAVDKGELGLSGDGAWGLEIGAVYPDGTQVSRAVALMQSAESSVNDTVAGDVVEVEVAPDTAKAVEVEGAVLQVEADAVERPERIRARGLAKVDLARLDAGMVNVTRGPKAGYRFLPHGQKFKNKIKLKLPYDPAKLPAGVTEDQIRTYFFDTDRGVWAPLERAELREGENEVVSLTDHFTDFINAVVVVPDHPETHSLNPTQFKDMKAANPGAKVNLIEAPQANASGDVRLSYPIELPPGRTGLAPSVNLSYSSSAENGWLGLGWNLSLSTLEVDTRWGVPRYDAAKETETYSLDGEMLAPVAHRGPLIDRTADKVFNKRSDSDFQRIVRHGDAPSNYWWEVRDKDGTAYFYGGLPESGLVPGATLRDANGNVFRWALAQVRDTNGNTIDYAYDLISDVGMASGSVPGTMLYPAGLTYTGNIGTGEAGDYTVTFTRDTERRKDVIVDGRGGFKMVTAERLKRIEVRFGAELVRAYELTYQEGAYAKSLLQSVMQLDADNAPFNQHDFAYYDDARGTGGAYLGFTGSQDWSPNVAVEESLLVQDSDTSSISASEGDSAGGHLYVGIAYGQPSKSQSVGAKVGTSSGTTKGLVALIDIDGDGLADKVYKNGGAISYERNLSGPDGSAAFGGGAATNAGEFQIENTSMDSFGPEIYLGAFFLGVNNSTRDTESPVYFRDVNGDGLVDIVSNGQVLFNDVENGTPSFTTDSSQTPYPVGNAAVANNLASAELAAIEARQRANNPLVDTLRRWTAPFDGTIDISGAVALIEDTSPERADYATADGVRVAVQLNAAELWSADIAATDYAAKTPTGVTGLAVQKDDVVYFRVQSREDGAYDEVSWDPSIAYQGLAQSADGNGLDPSLYNASGDFTLLGLRGAAVRMPYDGTVRVTGAFDKLGSTSDDVTVELLKNGAVIASQTLAAANAGTITLNESVSVLRDIVDPQTGQLTQTGDSLELRVSLDSRVDATQLRWLPSAPPRVTYTAISTPQTELTSPSDPSEVAIDLPAGADLYSTSDRSAPLAPVTFAGPGTYDIDVSITATGTGEVRATAKSDGELLAKDTLVLSGGTATATLSVTTTQANQDVFVAFNIDDPALADSVTARSATQAGSPVETAVYSNSMPSMLLQEWRGWTAFGYRTDAVTANAPVSISASDLDPSAMASFDPNAYRNRVETLRDAAENGDDISDADLAGAGAPMDPASSSIVTYTPDFVQERLEGADGQDGELWAAADALSASRQGLNAIIDASSIRFAGGRAVSLVSVTEQTAIAGGVSAGPISGSGSVTDATSRAILDFKDLNGDRFPDVIAEGLQVQFSPMTGGLEGAAQAVGTSGAAQRTESESSTIGIGGNFAHVSANASGGVDTRAGLSGSSETGQQMASIGFSANTSQGESDVERDLYDINGDGLPDRVAADGGALRVQLNVGYSFLAEEVWDAGVINRGENEGFSGGLSVGFNDGIYGFGGGINGGNSTSWSRESLQDVNGDGLLDRVLEGAGGLSVAFNTGNGFEAITAFPTGLGTGDVGRTEEKNDGGGAYFTISIPISFTPPIFLIINPGADFSRSVSGGEVQIEDVDGDGYADHLASGSATELRVSTNTRGRTNMLRSVQRPLGGSLEVDYTRTGNTYEQPQNRWAMSRLVIDDGQPGDGQDLQIREFTWEGGFYERRERAFYGFERSTETDIDPATNQPYRVTERTYENDTFYLNQRLETETVSDAAGNPYTQVEHTYQVRDEATGLPLADPDDLTAHAFAQRVRTDRRWFEGQAQPGKTTFETFKYDEYGNVSRYRDASEATPDDDVEAQIAYHEDLTTYVVGKVDEIRVFGGSGQLMRERLATFETGTGNLTQVVRRLADGGEAVTDIAYDIYGNIASLTGPENHRGQRYGFGYTYEAETNTHVASVTDSFGYTSTAEHDLRWGEEVRTVDINGEVTTTEHDSVGRPVTVTGPYQQGEGVFTIAMDYHPGTPGVDGAGYIPWARTRHIDVYRDVNDTLDTVTFIDGLKRVTQTKKDLALHTSGNASTDVMVVSGRSVYDGFGRVIEQHYPVTEPVGTPSAFNPAFDPITPTRTAFDILDRKTQVVNPANEATQFAYGFGADRAGQQQFRTRVTDANGVPREVFRDVDDDIVSVKLVNGGGSEILWTSYAYDPLDQIVAVTDAEDNVTRSEYDNFGRRVAIDSPDAGRTEYGFDPASNLHTKETANLRAAGEVITYAYEFNRIAERVYPLFPENDVTYTYGAPGAEFGRANRAWRITSESGVEELKFGPLGETVEQVRTVATKAGPDPVYTTQWTYDTWNRVQALTYPDGEVLDFRYDSGGNVVAIAGQKGLDAYGYLAFLGYDKFEARVRVAYANGTETDYAYDPQHRRMRGLLAETAPGRVFMDMAYGYDAVGNVLSLDNTAPVPSSPSIKGGPVSYDFAYDDLYQLIAADGTYETAPNKTERFDLALRYDAIHNITEKVQRAGSVKRGGNTNSPNAVLIEGDLVQLDRKLSYDWTYRYESPRPHAASQVGDRSFLYDANGNLAGWDSDVSGQRRRLVWDEENRLQEVADNGRTSTYAYDDGTTRIIKRGPGGETLYINQWYVANNGRNSKHVFAGQTRIVTKLEMAPTGEGRGPDITEPTNGNGNGRGNGNNASNDNQPGGYERFQYFYHPDHLGSTSYVTDEAGEVYQQLEYFPQGETWINEVGNDDRIPYRFTGKELDEETQLYYFGARYYDPRVSLWTSTDPALGEYLPNTDKVGNGKRELEMHAPSLSSDWRVMFGDLAGMGGAFEPKNMALYTYSHNNPVIIVDPDGEEAFLVSRPLSETDRAGHLFVIVTDDATGKLTHRFSFGPAASMIDSQLVSLTGTNGGVDTVDAAAASLVERSGGQSIPGDSIYVTKIGTPDQYVIDAGRELEAVLGTPSQPGNIRYRTLPYLRGANSNSAAYAIAVRAREKAGLNGNQALPDTINPGSRQYFRIPLPSAGPSQSNVP